MAKAIPMTPRFIQIPNKYDSATRTMAVAKIETYIVKRTSPAARRPLVNGD